MFEKHKMEYIRFEDNNAFVKADVSGGDMPVGEEEEEGWPEDGDN